MKNVLLLIVTIGLIPFLIFSENWMIRCVVLLTILLVWQQVILSLFIRPKNKQIQDSDVSIDTLMNQNIKLVEHMRHEWLNHFQVVTGYIQLQKFDKITNYLQQVKEQSLRDSLLSRLGIPSLIHYLLHLRTVESVIKIDWVIGKNLNTDQLVIKQSDFSNLLQELINKAVIHAENGNQPFQALLYFEASTTYLRVGIEFADHFSEDVYETRELKQIALQYHPAIEFTRMNESSQLVIQCNIPYQRN